MDLGVGKGCTARTKNGEQFIPYIYKMIIRVKYLILVIFITYKVHFSSLHI